MAERAGGAPLPFEVRSPGEAPAIEGRLGAEPRHHPAPGVRRRARLPARCRDLAGPSRPDRRRHRRRRPARRRGPAGHPRVRDRHRHRGGNGAGQGLAPSGRRRGRHPGHGRRHRLRARLVRDRAVVGRAGPGRGAARGARAPRVRRARRAGAALRAGRRGRRGRGRLALRPAARAGRPAQRGGPRRVGRSAGRCRGGERPGRPQLRGPRPAARAGRRRLGRRDDRGRRGLVDAAEPTAGTPCDPATPTATCASTYAVWPRPISAPSWRPCSRRCTA